MLTMVQIEPETEMKHRFRLLSASTEELLI